MPGLRWLHTSGQIGMRPDGSMVPTHAEEREQTWANVHGVLASAGMGVEHIVRVNAYVTSLEQVPLYRAGRDAALAPRSPPRRS